MYLWQCTLTQKKDQYYYLFLKVLQTILKRRQVIFFVYIDWEVLYIIYKCVKERSWSS